MDIHFDFQAEGLSFDTQLAASLGFYNQITD